jgi:hypothetical protein
MINFSTTHDFYPRSPASQLNSPLYIHTDHSRILRLFIRTAAAIVKTGEMASNNEKQASMLGGHIQYAKGVVEETVRSPPSLLHSSKRKKYFRMGDKALLTGE